MSRSRRKGKTRPYIQAPRAIDPGVPCSHCGMRYGHKILNTYPNGNRRRMCSGCGKPFVTMRLLEVINESQPQIARV